MFGLVHAQGLRRLACGICSAVSRLFRTLPNRGPGSVSLVADTMYHKNLCGNHQIHLGTIAGMTLFGADFLNDLYASSVFLSGLTNLEKHLANRAWAPSTSTDNQNDPTG
jgi:hypothetical protein